MILSSPNLETFSYIAAVKCHDNNTSKVLIIGRFAIKYIFSLMILYWRKTRDGMVSNSQGMKIPRQQVRSVFIAIFFLKKSAVGVYSTTTEL